MSCYDLTPVQQQVFNKLLEKFTSISNILINNNILEIVVEENISSIYEKLEIVREAEKLINNNESLNRVVIVNDI